MISQPRPSPFLRRYHLPRKSKRARNGEGLGPRLPKTVDTRMHCKVGLRACNNLPQPPPYIFVFGGCGRLLHALNPIYLAVLSCIYSFWHGVIPTSYFIFTFEWGKKGQPLVARHWSYMLARGPGSIPTMPTFSLCSKQSLLIIHEVYINPSHATPPKKIVIITLHRQFF